MLTAAKEGTFSAFSASSDPCVFFPLAASEGVPKNSRLGFARKNPAPHQGSAWSNSGKALGIEEVVWEICGGSDDSARYYDPAVGRFVSEDPIGFSGGFNFYRYARNNPVRRKDPSGLCPIFVGYRPELTMLPTFGPPIQFVHTFIVLGCWKDRNVLESEPTETPFPWNKPKIDAETYPLIPGLDPSNPVWTDPEIFVRDDGRPCSSDLKALSDFAHAVNNASVRYHLLGSNSNSVTSGGLSALGINDWSPPVIAHGWGSPIPH